MSSEIDPEGVIFSLPFLGFLNLYFSFSACNRPPNQGKIQGFRQEVCALLEGKSFDFGTK